MMIGVPIAYSLGLAALAGALWIDLPFDARHDPGGIGREQFLAAGHSVFVLAGAVHR